MEDIDGVEGVGIVTAMRILAGMELGRRVYGLCRSERSFVKDSEDAYGLLRDIGSKKQEYVVGLFLNSRFEVLDKRVVGMGSLDIVSVLPRDIITPALELNAALVVIAHNHPSGDPSPSEEDILFTKRLSEALDLVGIKLLDHIVIAGKMWKSIV
jgi:DNA repair protein RadC